jgi:hypothetical protein
VLTVIAFASLIVSVKNVVQTVVVELVAHAQIMKLVLPIKLNAFVAPIVRLILAATMVAVGNVPVQLEIVVKTTFVAHLYPVATKIMVVYALTVNSAITVCAVLLKTAVIVVIIIAAI